MKKLERTKLKDISNKIEQGQSSRQIAESTGVSHTTINNYRKSLDLNTPKPKAGAPRKLSPRDKRHIVNLATGAKIKTAIEIAKEVNIFKQLSNEKTINVQTVRRALKEQGFETRVRVNKPKLTVKHRKARLKWAEAHKEWTLDDWKRVIWSDETKINRFCSDGIRFAWIRPTNKCVIQEKQIKPTVKFGGGNIMVWGAMTWAGMSKLARVEGRMNANQFCSILDQALIPTIQASLLIPDLPSQEELIFQQDNDPKHTSKLAKNWFEAKNIKLMPWPAQSPDLNPIEHLWSIIKTKLGRFGEAPKGTHDLWDRVQEVSKDISLDTCRSLISSMPDRVKAVLKARGGQTRY